jgi:hypothetical protein
MNTTVFDKKLQRIKIGDRLNAQTVYGTVVLRVIQVGNNVCVRTPSGSTYLLSDLNSNTVEIAPDDVSDFMIS